MAQHVFSRVSSLGVQYHGVFSSLDIWVSTLQVFLPEASFVRRRMMLFSRYFQEHTFEYDAA